MRFPDSTIPWASCLASGLLTLAADAGATTYVNTLTGVQAHDQPGGSGAYLPGYLIQPVDGQLAYRFAAADAIDVVGSGAADVFAAHLLSSAGASPTVLDVAAGAGTLELSAVRPVAGTWGNAIGLDVDGTRIDIQGRSTIYAQSDDPVPTSASLGVRVRSGAATFRDATVIRTYTPGYSQGLWVYQGTLDFNGPATITAQARGASTSGVYNSGGGASRITFHQGASVSALGIHPSDNVHGVYNDNQNSVLRVDGALNITASSQGSTAFGVRNQGLLEVTGNAGVTVTGPRSTFGIANTHRTARVNIGGNVTVDVTNGGGYVPFGNPTGIGNTYAGSASMRYDGDVTVGVRAATEAYGVDNASTLFFSSVFRRVALDVSSSCTGCNVYGIRNQGGSVTAAGGLTVSVPAPSGGKSYALWNLASGGRASTVSVNEAGGQAVQLTGDVVTGAPSGETALASTRVVLSAPGSFHRGGIDGYHGDAGYYRAGNTELTIGANTTWRTGTANRADFGAGKLLMASLGVVDLTDLHTGALAIDGSVSPGIDVTFADRATLRLDTDVSGVDGPATAGGLVLGSGVRTFSAPGTLQVVLGHDPLLDNDRLTDVDADVVYPIASRPVLVDVTQAAANAATINAVEGRRVSMSITLHGATRIAYVQPLVALSADHKQVVLTGLRVRVLPSDTIFRGTME